MKIIDDKDSPVLRVVLTSKELSAAVTDYILKMKPEYNGRVLGTSCKEGFESDGIRVAVVRK